jgi:Fic family protein
MFAYEARQMALFEPGNDVGEVVNYVRALEYGLQRLAKLPLSLRRLCEIHARLMKGASKGVSGAYFAPGEFRRTQNWIGPAGSILETAPYVPPPVDEMTLALNALEKYLHSASDLPPLIRLGLIHYQFESIHPFLNGNGRVGRLLISLLLCAWELLPQPRLYLSAYFESSRPAYYANLLAVSETGAWEAWLIYFLAGVASQSRDAVERIYRLQDLHQAYWQRFQSGRASARLLQAVDLLFTSPTLTARQVEATLKIDFTAAQRYINQLVKAGIVRAVTGFARNRVYRADDVLAAIDGPL